VAPGDGWGSKLVVLLGEFHGVVGVVIRVIEGVRLAVERLRVLLQLLQLLDDRRPHRLRDNSTHRLTDLAQLDLQLEDVGATLTPVEDGLKFLGGSQAGLHADLGASSTRVRNAWFITTS